MAGSGRSGVELLAGAEKQVAGHPAADTAVVRQKTGRRRPGRTGVGGLGRAAANVGSRRHQVRFVPAIVGRSRAGKKGDRVGVVRHGVRRAATVLTPEGLHTLGRANGNDVFRGAGR